MQQTFSLCRDTVIKFPGNKWLAVWDRNTMTDPWRPSLMKTSGDSPDTARMWDIYSPDGQQTVDDPETQMCDGPCFVGEIGMYYKAPFISMDSPKDNHSTDDNIPAGDKVVHIPHTNPHTRTHQ
jgi:hypothetical protein